MNPEAQRIAIAQACGWKWSIWNPIGKGCCYLSKNGVWGSQAESDVKPCDNYLDGVPDYLNDLNAMHEAEKMLTDKNAYGIKLRSVVQQQAGESYFKTFGATAAQRSEAFLRALNLWTD